MQLDSARAEQRAGAQLAANFGLLHLRQLEAHGLPRELPVRERDGRADTPFGGCDGRGEACGRRRGRSGGLRREFAGGLGGGIGHRGIKGVQKECKRESVQGEMSGGRWGRWRGGSAVMLGGPARRAYSQVPVTACSRFSPRCGFATSVLSLLEQLFLGHSLW